MRECTYCGECRETLPVLKRNRLWVDKSKKPNEEDYYFVCYRCLRTGKIQEEIDKLKIEISVLNIKLDHLNQQEERHLNRIDKIKADTLASTIYKKLVQDDIRHIVSLTNGPDENCMIWIHIKSEKIARDGEWHIYRAMMPDSGELIELEYKYYWDRTWGKQETFRINGIRLKRGGKKLKEYVEENIRRPHYHMDEQKKIALKNSIKEKEDRICFLSKLIPDSSVGGIAYDSGIPVVRSVVRGNKGKL